MPDKKKQGDKTEESRRFINEKIVKQPLSRRELLRRGAYLAAAAVIFGGVAAVTFAVSKPVAERYLVKETQRETMPVTIPKDDPEPTTQPTVAATSTTQETKPMEEMVREALKNYSFTIEDVNALYDGVRMVAQKADKSIVTVHSVKNQTDWFDNPVESSGLFAGAVIASANGEFLILTPEAAVESADSIRVVFSDGTEVDGTIKQMDTRSGMAVVSILQSALGKTLLDSIQPIELGNSYSVRQGDMVIAIGAPAGVVHSTNYGFVTYVAKNVQITDGLTRVIYADMKGSPAMGTFLINTSGQIVGWVTDLYKNENNSDMTAALAISDFKSILERLSNGQTFPYLGIKGQEVTAVMNEAGIPLGIYVSEVNADSPVYNSGIQNGDIIVRIGEETIVTMKDLETVLETLNTGDTVNVKVLRSGREGYTEIEYQVTIGAR
ncbi:MAG TPA: S1C family serine protease [Candidatus Hungatella pullicola]|nr:S1C family serine protease [Candidatus Hungatella pullicola]